MLNKNAQAVMEFLMTYGWAILIVMISMGTLAYFVDFKSISGNRCSLAPPLYCKSYQADAGSVTLVIKNGLSEGIKVKSIELIDKECAQNRFNKAEMAANSEMTFVISCPSVYSSEKLRTDIKIVYEEEKSLQEITKLGNLVVAVS